MTKEKGLQLLAEANTVDAGTNKRRKVPDAAPAHWAVLEEKLQGAAAGLDFNHKEYQHHGTRGNYWFVRPCPYCGKSLWLGSTYLGDVHAYKLHFAPYCASLPSIEQWLRRGRFDNPADNEAVWDECRKAQEAKAADAAWLKARATELGFTAANGRWMRKCPCGGNLELFINKNDWLEVVEFGWGPTCSEIHFKWLREAGFVKKGES